MLNSKRSWNDVSIKKGGNDVIFKRGRAGILNVFSKAAMLLFTLACLPSASFAAQGVSDKEIVLGGHHDLSGPFAAFSAPAVQAAQLYFEQVNAAGGVHGRKIKYVVVDHGYQVPKAIQAVNKLINRDKVFAMLLSLGTPHNLAAFRLLDKKKIPNVAPLSAARQMLQDPYELKFAFMSTYFDQIRVAVHYMKAEMDIGKVCAMIIPSDYGNDVLAGAKLGAEESELVWGGETTHKADESDFIGALTKLKAEKCQLVVMALSVRGTISALSTAKKIGWNDVQFLGSAASFHTAVATVPGGVTEGFWAAAGWQDLAARSDQPKVAEWIKAYEAKTGEAPSSGAILGRSAAEIIVRGLQGAGRDLTVESFRAGMENVSFKDEIAGNVVKYSIGDHQAAEGVYLSQIKEGQWETIASGL